MQRSFIMRLAILTILLSCTMMMSLNIVPASAQSPCDWIEYSSNPVFGQLVGYSARTYYPKVIYDPNQFSGHGVSAYYKMWFNSDNGTGGNYSIGYAYSSNGTNWTAVMNPVNGLASRSGHPVVKYASDGFGGSTYYNIWYWDEGANIYSINALRHAESNDGINWFNDQPLTQDVNYPLITGNPGPDGTLALMDHAT